MGEPSGSVSFHIFSVTPRETINIPFIPTNFTVKRGEWQTMNNVKIKDNNSIGHDPHIWNVDCIGQRDENLMFHVAGGSVSGGVGAGSCKWMDGDMKSRVGTIGVNLTSGQLRA